jgi:GT2 family glycosyltransferase
MLMENSQVTIVVVPRERFSYAQRSLTSIYTHTTFPFELIYIDAGTPAPVRQFLGSEAERKGFRLLSAPGYLSPNQARNLGWREVQTKYTVFLDNDALVTPGWLDALARCAEETEAWVVGPLYLIGEIERQTIHMAGGRVHIKEHHGKRVLYDEQYLFERRLSDVQVPLQRQPWDYVEFHCMLVRTDLLDRLGPLDEKLLSLHEHIDLGLSVRNAGGAVYLEPKAVTSYVPPPPCEWWDLPYFMLRWSEAWNLATVRHFNQKWGVSALLWFNEKSTPDTEETIIKFARGHRRFMTGLRAPADGAGYRPELPSEQAELMIAMFLALDRDCFDLTLKTENQDVIETMAALGPQQIFQRLPQVLQEADEKKLNILIQPVSSGQTREPALLRVDELDHAATRELKSYAFLTLETSPEHFQCWLAVDRSHWRDGASLRKLVGQAATENGGHLAGSKNVRREFRQSTGSYPTVRLVEAATGLLVSVHQLEKTELLPYLWSSHMF